ncbi:MAG: dihydrofolate reductase family protein [Ignavibacteriales bacterium]|nr:dihydrofolate reductase family protein [Ignavibacteriales bacterium]
MTIFLAGATGIMATVLSIENGSKGIYNIVDDEPAPASTWLPVLASIINSKPPLRVSLDGYIRAADGDLSWIFHTYDDELKSWEVDLLWQAGTHIMGCNLYDEMAAYWPASNEAFAPPMNEIPKVVYSKSMKQADWKDTQVYNGDLVKGIAQLKQEPGKEILVHGGASFIHSLSKYGLIDEFKLILHPLFLTGGLPLFKETTSLKLLQTSTFP